MAVRILLTANDPKQTNEPQDLCLQLRRRDTNQFLPHRKRDVRHRGVLHFSFFSINPFVQVLN